MKKYKINEIFYSLQGEGNLTGTAAVFVRFSGCNLKCQFCDTKHQEGQMYTADEICRQIANYPALLVVLTGGEPTLQIDEALIDALHAHDFFVAIETNGTIQPPDNVDWVTLSPKDMFCENATPIITEVDEIKVVFTGELINTYDHILAAYRYIQPCDTGDPYKNAAIIKKAIEYVKNNPKWRLSLQTQKILNVR